MSVTDSKLLKRTILAVAAGFAIGCAPSSSAVADGDKKDGSCCADLDERISELEATTARTRPLITIGKGDKDGKDKEERMTLKIQGVVNHAILAWSDGFESNTYIVDSPQNGTAFTLEGEVGLGGGWKAGFVIGFDTLVAPADEVDQTRPRGDPAEMAKKAFAVSDSFWFIGHDKWGKLNFGLTDTATDGIDNINLSGTDAVADVEIGNWVNNFFLRAGSGRLLTEVTWGDFIPSVAGDTANVITYVSPKFKGFEASASWGRDDYWDVALRYSGTWADVLKVKGGIGYYRNRSEENGNGNNGFEPVEDQGWGASLAFRHIPTGLNLAVNYGRLSHTKRCEHRGVVSGLCRGDDEFYYVKGGVARRLFASLGDTAFYGEYYRGTRAFNESDEDKLQDLGLVDDPARELRSSVLTVWGFGVVQKIDDLEKKEKKGKKENGEDAKEDEGKDEDPPIELYLGYRHYDLNVELLGEAGSAVPSKKLNGFDAIMTGAKIRF